MTSKNILNNQQSENNFSDSRSPSPFGNETSSFKSMFEVFQIKFGIILINNINIVISLLGGVNIG